MKTYVVGGAVRDELLGLPIVDRDHVVVGSTPQQMIDAGFKPVGRDFPVFLHPDSREEYALARTERKVAPGYAGFAFHSAPDVTLEQDLARRDLTINAIAKSDTGELIDPYDGQRDLQARVLRHVGPAFVEDPVRILRLARFAARFTEFSVAAATLALMQRMVASGEVDALVAERVWQELSRGLMESKPSRMFALLQDCGALARVLPELSPMSMPTMQAIDASADSPASSLAVRFTVLVLSMPLGDGSPRTDRVNALAKRIRAPVELRDLALLACAEQSVIAAADTISADKLVSLLERCDSFRKPLRLLELLDALSIAHATNTGAISVEQAAESINQAHQQLRLALAAATAVDAGTVARAATANSANSADRVDPAGLATPVIAGERIKQAIHVARVAAVEQALATIAQPRQLR